MSHAGRRRAERPRSRTGGARRLLREALLWTGAVLGLLSLLFAAASLLFGVKALVFRSGSMQPAIATGALGLARDVPATEVRDGDVVSVVAASGVRVTHRVVAVGEADGGVSLTLQGDANRVPDAEAYVVQRVDRVFADLPYAGYVLSALGTPTAMFGGGMLAATAIYLAFLSPGARGDRPSSGGRRADRALPAAAIGLAAASLALPPAAVETLAFFTDSGSLASQPLTAATIPAPVATCGSNTLGGQIQVAWTAAAGATGYRVHSGPNGNNTETVSASVRSYTIPSGFVASGGTFWVVTLRSFGSVQWESGRSNTISYGRLLGIPFCNAS